MGAFRISSVSALVSFVALVACSSGGRAGGNGDAGDAGDDASHCTKADDCTFPIAQIGTVCLGTSAGIFGRELTSCRGGGAPPSCGAECVSDGVVTIQQVGDGGASFSPHLYSNHYFQALDPGSYQVCCDSTGSTETGGHECATATLTAGTKAELDIEYIESPGGDYCQVTAGSTP